MSGTSYRLLWVFSVGALVVSSLGCGGEEAEEKVEPALEEKEEPALEENAEPKPQKRTRKSKRLSKRDRDAKKAADKQAEDEKRWAEDAKKPDGWDLPDLPEGTVLPTW